jgi:hypothetical protein
MGPVLRGLLLLFSQLFHGLLGLFLTGLGLVALLSGKHTLRLDLLPWEGVSLTYSVLVLGLYALASVLLSIFAGTRAFLAVQAFGVAALLVRGVFLTPVPLEGNPLSWETTALLLAGALLAAAGVAAGPGPAERRRTHA